MYHMSYMTSQSHNIGIVVRVSTDLPSCWSVPLDHPFFGGRGWQFWLWPQPRNDIGTGWHKKKTAYCTGSIPIDGPIPISGQARSCSRACGLGHSWWKIVFRKTWGGVKVLHGNEISTKMIQHGVTVFTRIAGVSRTHGFQHIVLVW